MFKLHLSDAYTIPLVQVGSPVPVVDYVDAERGRYVFMLDQSKSMSGRKIEVAKEALHLFL